MNLFSETNKKGKAGEEIVKQYYLSFGNVVVDVSGLKEYQEKDIDLLINGQSVEVKTATKIQDYREIVIELISNDSPLMFKKGWYYTSEAEIIIYYSPKEKAMYQLRMDELRSYYEKHKDTIKTKRVYYNEFADIRKPSVLAFIPLEEIEANIKAYRKIIIDI